MSWRIYEIRTIGRPDVAITVYNTETGELRSVELSAAHISGMARASVPPRRLDLRSELAGAEADAIAARHPPT